MMTEEELRNYNLCQIEEILKFKWIESEKVGHDIGENKAAIQWITQYGSLFREFYISSNKQD